MKDMKFKIAMAPTPEQEAPLKQMMGDYLRTQGATPGDGFWCEEKIVTIDEALEIFQMYKQMP